MRSVLRTIVQGAELRLFQRPDGRRQWPGPVVIDPELFGPAADFRARVDRMIEQTKTGKRARDIAEILVPGEEELRAREHNLQGGVPLRLSRYRALRQYADRAQLTTELIVT